jgi:uncharacterized membrane protein (DUF2068 family)
MRQEKQKKTGIVRLIGAAKLVKGLLLLLVGIGALHYLRKDVTSEIIQWADRLDLDPNNVFLQTVLEHTHNLTTHKKAWLAAATFIYAALFLTEGVGLIMVKVWAEYFAIIITSSFLPIEAYELAKKFSAVKLVVIILNAAIVVYLARRLYKAKHHGH